MCNLSKFVIFTLLTNNQAVCNIVLKPILGENVMLPLLSNSQLTGSFCMIEEAAIHQLNSSDMDGHCGYAQKRQLH